MIESGIKRPVAEIVAVLACVMAVEWLILPFTRSPLIIAIPVIIGVVIIFFAHRKRSESIGDVGWRFDGFIHCWRLLILPTAILAILTAAIGFYYGSFRPQALTEWSFKNKYLFMFLWAAIQQHILQAFFNRRSQEIWGKGFASLVFATAVFALVHLPNLTLTVATFIGGLCWTAIYQRVPNLFALSISQALLTILLYVSVPSSMLHGGRVGFNYFRL